MRELKIKSVFGNLFDDDYITKKIYARIENRKKFERSISIKNYFLNVKSPRSAKKTPKQCVVKLCSNLTSKGGKNALFYIAKNSLDNLIMNENGERLSPSEVFKSWQKDFSKNENSKDCWHLVFSVKDESRNQPSLDALLKAVNDTMKENFFGYKYALCVHSHQNNPHVHVVINKRNIFTENKIHFDSKDEIKEFFNNVRDDYAKNLNFQGFNYFNVNSMAKDLNKEKSRAENALNNAYDTKFKCQNVYNTLRELSEEKIVVKTIQKENVDKELEKNLLEHQHLIDLLNQYNYYENKKKWAVLAKIKENNKERKELCDTGKRVDKELKDIKRNIEKINASANEIYKSNLSDYNTLKSFCYDFEKRFLKNADKKSMDFYFKAQKELKEIGNKIDCDLKNSIDSAMLYKKLFNKDENCFNIIKGLDMIEKNKTALYSCDFLNDDEKKGYEKIFNDNEKFMRELLDKRFEKIKEKVENSDNLSKNDFLYKEYKKTISYLNIDIEFSNKNISGAGGLGNKKSSYKNFEPKVTNNFGFEI